MILNDKGTKNVLRNEDVKNILKTKKISAHAKMSLFYSENHNMICR